MNATIRIGRRNTKRAHVIAEDKTDQQRINDLVCCFTGHEVSPMLTASGTLTIMAHAVHDVSAYLQAKNVGVSLG